jgi:hypothetical protein
MDTDVCEVEFNGLGEVDKVVCSFTAECLPFFELRKFDQLNIRMVKARVNNKKNTFFFRKMNALLTENVNIALPTIKNEKFH